MATFASILLVVSLVPAAALITPVEEARAQPVAQDGELPVSGESGTCTWEIDANGKLTIRPTDGVSGTLLPMKSKEEDIYGYSRNDSFGWLAHASRITSGEVMEGVSASGRLSEMFNYCSNMTSLDLSKLDTSNATDMSLMFGSFTDGCRALEHLDLSGFDTSNVTDMSAMFQACNSLKELDLSSFDTSKVTNMHSMFSWGIVGSKSLESLTFSPSFDTSNVTDMGYMFSTCHALKNLDLSSFNTSKVTDMNGMFFGCSSLKDLDLSSFDTSNVTNMGSMFYGCSLLTNLDISSFRTSSVTNLFSMFGGCGRLVSVDTSHFDTSKVANMSNMFQNCSSLTSLDLSSFDTSAVSSGAPNMFEGCSSLREVSVGAGFSFDEVAPTQLPEGSWVSKATGSAYTPLQIATDRNNVADTYTRGTVGDLRDAAVAPIPDQTYTGGELRPVPVVTLGGRELSEGADYTLTYSSNVNAGTGLVTVSGAGAYGGSKTATFKVNPAQITSVSLGTGRYVYDGTRKMPTVAVRCGDKVLQADRDYYVAGTQDQDLAAVGAHELSVVGVGNYAGTIKASFEIAGPEVVEAPSAAWRPGSAEPAAFRSSAPLSEFVEVRVDGGVVDRGFYDLSEGSTVVRLRPAYLGTLGVGAHSIGIVSRSGTATAAFSVEAAPEPSEPDDPKPDAPGITDPEPADPGSTDPKPEDPGVKDPDTNPGADPEPSGPGATDPEPVGTQAMYRLYNPNSGEHFYTASTVERDAVIAAGWNDEGVGWTAPTSGIQVYRLYNSYAGEHHYTTSAEERDMLVSVGWTWEEGGWFSDINQSVPLYRAYNPNAFANNHHYTTDWGEFVTLLGLGWQDEGVGWHGVN